MSGRVLWYAALALAAATRGAAQDGQAPWRVVWSPARPSQGSLASVSVVPESVAAAEPLTVTIGGEAAGEPLHFEPVPGEGRFWGLVAVPLDATDSMVVRLTIERAGRATDTLAVQLPASVLTVGTDQLRASPEFSRAPDSSLAARAAREAELMSSARRHSHETARLWSEQFVRPVPGRVTSRFGARREWNGTLRGRHDGVDLAGAAGTPVRAANRGVVALVAEQYYGGLTVFIDHGAGLVTSYQHLSGATVSVGDTVARGAVIGRVGATGNTTGPHLHWGTSYGAVPVDPLALLTVQPPP